MLTDSLQTLSCVACPEKILGMAGKEDTGLFLTSVCNLSPHRDNSTLQKMLPPPAQAGKCPQQRLGWPGGKPIEVNKATHSLALFSHPREKWAHHQQCDIHPTSFSKLEHQRHLFLVEQFLISSLETIFKTMLFPQNHMKI